MFEAEEGFITQRRKTQSIANKGVRVETGTEETETGADNKEKTTKKQKKRKQQKKDTKSKKNSMYMYCTYVNCTYCMYMYMSILIVVRISSFLWVPRWKEINIQEVELKYNNHLE